MRHHVLESLLVESLESLLEVGNNVPESILVPSLVVVCTRIFISGGLEYISVRCYVLESILVGSCVLEYILVGTNVLEYLLVGSNVLEYILVGSNVLDYILEKWFPLQGKRAHCLKYFVCMIRGLIYQQNGGGNGTTDLIIYARLKYSPQTTSTPPNPSLQHTL